MGSFFSFLRDVIADVKTSWRFRVATVLWIPLIVTAGVMVVRFGIRHTLSEKYREFKTTFIPETSVNYPDVQMFFSNQNYASGSCSQWGQNAQIMLQPCQNLPPRTQHRCIFLQLSLKTSNQNGNNIFGQPIHCNFTFNQNAVNQVDDEIFVLLPGGWDTNSKWNFDNPLFLRPNPRIGVQLFHEVFYSRQGKIDNWFSQHTYETSIFPSGSSAYNVSIRFSIPFNALEVNWEEDGFDSWFLLATWGGGFFFFYCLFLLAFNIAKFFLPDDSRLLRSGGDSTATPLIS